MATLPSHALVGAVIALAAAPKASRHRAIWAAGFLAMLPDADVVSFKLGIPYAAEWGHRGASHSLLFSVLAALPFALWIGRTGVERLKLWMVLALAGASHGLLDACTNGGLGVALAWPFDLTRYFAPWRPIQVSPIGGAALSARIWPVFASEALWIWLPCAAVLLFLRKRERP
jgi:inner membrane protein